MRVVVIGGTGLIGSKLVAILREGGHEAVPASPSTGVDTVTGKGLADVMTGTDVVVDVSNAPVWEDDAVREFFTVSTRNLLAAERDAGVGHHLAVTIVGADLLPDSELALVRPARGKWRAGPPAGLLIVGDARTR